MKILGTKFYGHDNSVFYLDTEKKEIFAVSNERITRIKHDRASVRKTVEAYPFLKEVDWVISGYEKQDNRKYYSDLYWYDFLYQVCQPKYIKELVAIQKKSFLGLKLFSKLFLSSKEYRHWLWDYFLYKKLKLSFGFNKARSKIDLYYQNLIGVSSSRIDHKDHHLCHAMSAYAFSPFSNEKGILSFTIDGIGDDAFSKLYRFDSLNEYECLATSVSDPIEDGRHDGTSIGFIYNDFTSAMDLIPNSDEGKVEALAAYATADPDFLKYMKQMVSFDGLNIKLDVEASKQLSNDQFLRSKRSELGDEVFAATVQTWLEDVIVDYLNKVHQQTGGDKICFSGGVAANIIMSLNVYERTPFKNIYVFPAMGDDGIAAGAAILKAVELQEDVTWLKDFYMPYFGASYSKEEIETELTNRLDEVSFEYIGEGWPEKAAESIAEGKIVSLFHGREEYGPRALGNRSIVANPRLSDVTKRINSTVKRRPLYQPFCPSILEDERERLFESSFKHKHMAIAFRMKKEFWDDLPSAIHVDGTARPQFVEPKDNPNYYRLLKAVKAHTGYGVIINTSFNLHGRTMVHSPFDAVTDFIDCNIDELYIEGFKVERKQ